jgi:hypothetical protein
LKSIKKKNLSLVEEKIKEFRKSRLAESKTQLFLETPDGIREFNIDF